LRISDALGDKDLLDVIAFDSAPTRIVALGHGDAHVDNDAKIATIQAGGGTDFLPALDAAYADLGKVSAKRKHVVLVSDGAAPSNGVVALVTTMSAEAITVSTIALGDSADDALLRSIADASGGRTYIVRSPTKLAAVFAQELALVRP
jgi:uncharacterized protein with von Willebrand factor type A (vWA) domain